MDRPSLPASNKAKLLVAVSLTTLVEPTANPRIEKVEACLQDHSTNCDRYLPGKVGESLHAA
jgi:hypothetical protein